MATQSIQSKVTTRANQLVSKHGRKMAFIMAWAAEKLIEQMTVSTSVEFNFIKSDGSTRNAVGTLFQNEIEKHWTRVGSANHNHPDVVRYFDMEKLEWRSFRIDRLPLAA